MPGDPSKFRVKTSTTPELLFDNEEPVIHWMQTISEDVASCSCDFRRIGERVLSRRAGGDARCETGPGRMTRSSLDDRPAIATSPPNASLPIVCCWVWQLS